MEEKENIEIIIQNAVEEANRRSCKPKKWAVGVKELGNHLRISRSSAFRLHSSGKIAQATYKVGPRTYLFDMDHVLDILRQGGDAKRNKRLG